MSSILFFLPIVCLLQSVALGQKSLIQMDEKCLRQNLPLTVGGSRDEQASCMFYDPRTELIIVGGTTRSNDFGPALSPYGFIFAVNLQGDWTWGNYFQNFTSGVREVTACQLSNDGSQGVVMGSTRDQVVFSTIDTLTGKITNLYSLQDKESAKKGTRPLLQTYGALLLDSNDIRDGKSYIYASFLQDRQQELVKILQAIPDRTNEFPRIEYHYSFKDVDESVDPDPFIRQKTPQFMFEGPTDSNRDSFYISGTYRGVGSIMKFYKKNAALRWHAQLDTMTRVDAIAVREPSNDGHFFGCGQNNSNDRGTSRAERTSDSEAWIFSIDAYGEIYWMLKLAGSDPNNNRLQDSCQGLTYDKKNEKLIAAIETDSPQFKVSSGAKQKDTMLIEFDINGIPRRVVSYTLYGNSFDMLLFPQNLITAKDLYFMGGGLTGFISRSQMDRQSDDGDDNLDIFVFPFGFGNDRPTEDTIVDREILAQSLVPQGEFFNKRMSIDQYQLRRDNQRDVPKQSKAESELELYYSKFVMERPLNSFIRTPRPGAYQSLQLSEQPIEYFIGTKALEYRIAQESVYGSVITLMAPERGGVTHIVDQTGSETDLAHFSSEEGGIVSFETNVVRQVGLNELTIRHCDFLGRLFDLRLQIEVKRNQQPVFKSSPQTSFYMAVNETLYYVLPEAIDPDGNTEIQILFEPFQEYESLFPPFMNTFNQNRSFEFVPDSDEYAGQKYFFKMILKEAYANVDGFIFYCQVVIDPLPQSSDAGEQSGSSETNPTTDSSGESTETASEHQTQVTVDGETQTVAAKQIGEKRRGSVVVQDRFDDERAKERLFVVLNSTDLFGEATIEFTEPVDMQRVQEDFDEMFTPVVQLANYYRTPQNLTIQSLQATSFSNDDQVINVAIKFEDAQILGLNQEKSDYIVLYMNEDYQWKSLLGLDVDETNQGRMLQEEKPLQRAVRSRINLTFDYDNDAQKRAVRISQIFTIVMICFMLFCLCMLVYKKVGLLTFWILIDYLQLIAFLPLMTARCIPWVYELFRPMLMSHFIYRWPGQGRMSDTPVDEYYNIGFQAYDVIFGDFITQSLLCWGVLLVLIISMNITLALMSRFCRKTKYNGEATKFTSTVDKILAQFKYNMYLRFMMMSYMDFVFVCWSVLLDQKEDIFAWQSILSLILLVITSFLPWLILFFLCAKFKQMKVNKSIKKQLNTLLLKVDKDDRWRIFLPCFFFLRRFAISVSVVLGAVGIMPAWLQFVFLIMFSITLLFYLAKEEPYILRRQNILVFVMELTFLLLGMCLFAFTDATDHLPLKRIAAYSIAALILMLMFATFFMAGYFARKGRAKLKISDKKRKLFRKTEIERRHNDKLRRQKKRERKERIKEDKLKEERKQALMKKREELRSLGTYTEDEINEKLEEEPVEKAGFRFKGVMGKRLVDYGLQSSSTDEDFETDSHVSQSNGLSERSKPFSYDIDEDKTVKSLEMARFHRRRTSTQLPTNSDEEDERIDTDGPMTQRGLLSSQDRSVIQSLPSAIPHGHSEHDVTEDAERFNSLFPSPSERRRNTSIPRLNLQGTNVNPNNSRDSQVKMDEYCDEEVDEEYDDEDEEEKEVNESDNIGFNTDRPLVTEADDDDESAMFGRDQYLEHKIDQNPVENRQLRVTAGFGLNHNNAINENIPSMIVDQDPWTTQINQTADQSSHQFLFDGHDKNDEKIIKLASQDFDKR